MYNDSLQRFQGQKERNIKYGKDYPVCDLVQFHHSGRTYRRLDRGFRDLF